MESQCSKSPDPPEGNPNVEVALDEDSQESATLQNALSPLPDTQSTSQGTQRISPESHSVSTAPFISRPVQLNVDDLSNGFSFDKPSSFKPGHFSGRQQSKPIKPIVDLGVDASGLGRPSELQPEQATASRGFAMEKTRTIMHTGLPSPDNKGVVQEHNVENSHDSHSAIPSNTDSHLAQRYQCLRATEGKSTPAALPRPLTQKLVRPQVVEGEPTTVPFPQKKRPFPDYQPTYRAAEHRGQTSMPVVPVEAHADQVVGPLPNHELALNKGADVPENQQQHPIQSSAINLPQQKSRTSFHNDVSVSSSRPPRSMPGSSPRTAVVSRPMRDSHRRTSRMCTPATRPRSGGSIVKSNSKAKRTSRPEQGSSSSRSSSRLVGRDEETPSMMQRSKWTPAELLQDQFHQKLVTTAADLAGCFNDKFADIGAEVDQHLQTIADLKKGMSKQQQDLSRYKQRITGKDNKIQNLQEHCGDLKAQVETARQELDARSTKVSKLEEKCRSYKDFLNRAIAEQQELYKATKSKCDGTLAQMKTEERRRNALQEQERKQAEVTRERLNQLVQSTLTEYRQKERDFINQIESLNQKVQEREADVVRERETTRTLLDQEGNITNIQDTLKIFGRQIEEVIGKVNAVVTERYDSDNQSAKDMNIKLDQIMKCLRIIDERTFPTVELSKEMHKLSEKTVVSISEKLEPVIAEQLRTKATLDDFCSEVEAFMNDVLEDLDERQTLIERLYLKQEHEREKRVQLLQEEVQGLGKELDQQNQLVLLSHQELRQRQASIDKLHIDMANLEQKNERHLADSEQIERLRKEYEELKGESTTKAALIFELQSKLQEATVQLATEEQKRQEENNRFQGLMQKQVAEARAVHKQAVTAAQQDAMLRMNEVKANIDERLNQALDERTALQQQLDEAKQKMLDIEAESSRAYDKAINLEEELHASRAQVAKGIEQATLNDAKQQAAKEQQMRLLQELQTKLSSAEGSFDKLRHTTKSYDEAAQAILSSMKMWTASYANIRSTFRDLQQGRDQDGMLKGIDPRFKPLVELQLLQVAVSRYCQAQKEAAHLLTGDPAAAETVASTLPVMESLSMAAGSVLDRMRRVTVMSPASNASSPQPPSVQIEQERRRVVEPARSILKLIPHTQRDCAGDARPEDDADEELNNNTSMNRGPYNRLVAGSKSRAKLPVTRLSHRPPSSRSGSNSVSDRNDVAPGAKRKENSEERADHRDSRPGKKSASTVSMLAFSSPPKHVNGRARLDSVGHAPRKASLRGMVDFEQPDPLYISQSSQEQSQSQSAVSNTRDNFEDLNTTRGRLSQCDSTDPESLFSEVAHSVPSFRAKGESQDSLTHSQDVLNDRPFSIPSQYSFAP